MNSRPLVVETTNEGNSKVTLTPTSLLTVKSKVIITPPGEFIWPDIYCRKRWRRVQHLGNKFWSWWHKEFLLLLQEKQKWSSTRRNFQPEDIVILKDYNSRQNEWKLAKVVETFPDKKGFVRTGKLLIGSIDRNGSVDNWIFVQPNNKVVLLVESGEGEWWGSIFKEGAMKQEVKISWLSSEEPVVYGFGSHVGSHIEILNIKLFFYYLKNLRKKFLLFLLTYLQFLS